jgi:hypothetical protein
VQVTVMPVRLAVPTVPLPFATLQICVGLDG